MIKWKFKKNVEKSYNVDLKEEFMDVLVRINTIKHKEKKQEAINELIQKWIKSLEEDVIHKITNDNIFKPINIPSLFANQVVGVQAMSAPVGLAYATRVIYNDKEIDQELIRILCKK